MQNVVLTVHLILAICLIGVVLLQRSEGGGLGMGGGGGGAMSGRAAATALTKLTWLFAVLFIATSITLTIFAAQNSAGTSVLDQFGGTAPDRPTVPASPLGTDLLPPGPASSGDAALTPPRADGTVPATPGATGPAPDATGPAAPAEPGAAAPATPAPAN